MGLATSRYTEGLTSDRHVRHSPEGWSKASVHKGGRQIGHWQKHWDSRLTKPPMLCERADEHWLQLSKAGTYSCEAADEQWVQLSKAGTSSSADRPFDAQKCLEKKNVCPLLTECTLLDSLTRVLFFLAQKPFATLRKGISQKCPIMAFRLVPPPLCPSPPLVLPQGGWGAVTCSTQNFSLQLTVLLWQNHHPRVLPKAFQWKAVSMCKGSRSSGAGPRKFTPSWSRSRSPYIGSPLNTPPPPCPRTTLRKNQPLVPRSNSRITLFTRVVGFSCFWWM